MKLTRKHNTEYVKALHVAKTKHHFPVMNFLFIAADANVAAMPFETLYVQGPLGLPHLAPVDAVRVEPQGRSLGCRHTTTPLESGHLASLALRVFCLRRSLFERPSEVHDVLHRPVSGNVVMTSESLRAAGV
jgi:hypothetical protein